MKITSVRRSTADSLEKNRDELVAMLKRFPVEILSPSHADSLEENRFRVVITSEAQLNEVIRQLRAERVSREEALNPTLVLL